MSNLYLITSKRFKTASFLCFVTISTDVLFKFSVFSGFGQNAAFLVKSAKNRKKP